MNLTNLKYMPNPLVCAAAPRPDEKNFQENFRGFASDENLPSAPTYKKGATDEEVVETDMEWERLQSVLDVRARLAEQVDYIGMQVGQTKCSNKASMWNGCWIT